MYSKSTRPPASKVKLLKTTLASLEEVREIFVDEHSEAEELYDKWYATGEGDEEVLAENAWCAEGRVERFDRVIEDIQEILSM
jgi:hypothetical protein